MSNRSSLQRGYSFVEIIVVVGIIGIVSLVSVPAFMQYQQSAKVKSSMRQFTADVRGARQRAITKTQIVKLTFETGNGKRDYTFAYWQPPVGGTPGSWIPFGTTKQLQKDVYFKGSSFEDVDVQAASIADGDSKPDIVFRPDGTISPFKTEDESGTNVTKVTIKIDQQLPNNQFDIYFQSTGGLRARGSKT